LEGYVSPTAAARGQTQKAEAAEAASIKHLLLQAQNSLPPPTPN
jgi:hypothetical protein